MPSPYVPYALSLCPYLAFLGLLHKCGNLVPREHTHDPSGAAVRRRWTRPVGGGVSLNNILSAAYKFGGSERPTATGPARSERRGWGNPPPVRCACACAIGLAYGLRVPAAQKEPSRAWTHRYAGADRFRRPRRIRHVEIHTDTEMEQNGTGAGRTRGRG